MAFTHYVYLFCAGIEISNSTEGSSITLKCPPDVTGSHGGNNITGFSLNKKEEQSLGQTRFQCSPENKTLTVTDVQPDDAGLYYCDGKPAVYLRVTKGERKHLTQTLVVTVRLILNYL